MKFSFNAPDWLMLLVGGKLLAEVDRAATIHGKASRSRPILGGLLNITIEAEYRGAPPHTKDTDNG